MEIPRSDVLTPDSYPYKKDALFVFAAGGQPGQQILSSGAGSFKPDPVSAEVSFDLQFVHVNNSC